MKSVRYSLIYRLFAAQITFGYYRTGDPLPTIEELCRVYRASARTVRSAYLQLQEDGYIRLSAGRRTTVVYQSTPEDCSRCRRSYYLARRDAIPPLNEAMALLLLPLLREGCGRLSPQALRQLRQTAARLADGDFYISFLGGRAMLLATGNRLALDLFDAVVSFYQFPHVLLRFAGQELAAERFRALSAQAVDACGRGDRAAFFRSYLAIQVYMNEVLTGYLGLAEGLLPAQEQVAFDWGVYRARPQRCYSLAARLIGQVYLDCAYSPGDALPHHGELAQAHRVSYMTVRRTMELLETLGVVSVRHGGDTTVVRRGPAPEVPRSGALETLHTMAWEALELLSHALDGAAARFPAQPPERVRACAETLRAQSAAGLRTPALVACLDLLLGGGDGPLARVWDRLAEALLLDLPLLEARGADPRPGPEALLTALEAGDGAALRGALGALLTAARETAEAADGRGPGEDPRDR